jgi:hypothetical protein
MPYLRQSPRRAMTLPLVTLECLSCVTMEGLCILRLLVSRRSGSRTASSMVKRASRTVDGGMRLPPTFPTFPDRQGARDHDLCLRELGEQTTSARSRPCNVRVAPPSPQQPEATLSLAPASWMGQSPSVSGDGHFGIKGHCGVTSSGYGSPNRSVPHLQTPAGGWSGTVYARVA